MVILHSVTCFRRGFTKYYGAKIICFSNLTMDYIQFCAIFSAERTKKYKNATCGNQYFTQMLYFYNHRVARSFQPLVSNVEVILRNKLNAAIAKTYSDDKWLLHRIYGYAPTGRAPFTGRQPIRNPYLCDCLRKADSKLTRKGRSITQDRLISELDFGFWTALYNDSLPNEICAAVMSIFGPLPPGTNRQRMKGDLNKIRQFRNRICHNNTLFFDGSNVDVLGLKKNYQCIYNLTRYLSPEVSSAFHSNGLDKAREVIENLD